MDESEAQLIEKVLSEYLEQFLLAFRSQLLDKGGLENKDSAITQHILKIAFIKSMVIVRNQIETTDISTATPEQLTALLNVFGPVIKMRGILGKYHRGLADILRDYWIRQSDENPQKDFSEFMRFYIAVFIVSHAYKEIKRRISQNANGKAFLCLIGALPGISPLEEEKALSSFIGKLKGSSKKKFRGEKTLYEDFLHTALETIIKEYQEQGLSPEELWQKVINEEEEIKWMPRRIIQRSTNAAKAWSNASRNWFKFAWGSETIEEIAVLEEEREKGKHSFMEIKVPPDLYFDDGTGREEEGEQIRYFSPFLSSYSIREGKRRTPEFMREELCSDAIDSLRAELDKEMGPEKAAEFLNVLGLQKEGYTIVEIAKEKQKNEKTIRRWLDDMEKILKKLL